MLLPYLEPNRIEAGCDEAGRGCLAGSVFAAAVILPPDFKNDDLNGYKKMMPRWTWNCFDKYRDILLSIKESKCVKSLSDYLKELL